MTEKERYFLQRIVNWWDDEAEFIGDFVEEIREYLASEEPEKRGPLSATAIRDAIEVDANASWFGPFGQGFLVGVRWAEKMHGIVEEE